MKDVCYIHTCDLVPHNISPKGVAKEIVYERIAIYKETVLDIINGRTYSSQDYWTTTPVTEILEDTNEFVRFKTRNSEYEWKYQ